MPTPTVHVAARAYRSSSALTDHDVASWLWVRLRRAFPEAIAAVLMPDHVHLVTPALDVEAARRTLARLVGNLGRSRLAPTELRWQRVDTPQPIADVPKLLRQLRYVALNPVRAGLAPDPLAWPWSTYRDVMGAICEPWVTDAKIACLVGRPRAGFREVFHRYVSADPACRVAGPPGARPANAVELADAPLAWLADAAAAATRGAPDDIRRRSSTRAVFLALARTGGHSPQRLAHASAITPSGVHARWSKATRPLDAALLCLGDTRLRIPSRRSDGCRTEVAKSSIWTPHLPLDVRPK